MVVSNEVDTVKSDKVTLSAPPVITQLTESKTVGDGRQHYPLRHGAWHAAASAISGARKAWRLVGATGPTLAFAKAAVSDAGAYSVEVSNALGSSEIGCHHIGRYTCQQRLFPSQ